MRGPEKCSRLTQAPLWPILAGYENFVQNVLRKSVVRTGKQGSAIFYSRPRSKVELTRKNGKNTSNMGSKSYVWLLVRRIHGIASETRRLWSTVNHAFCNRLSYIEHTKSQGKTKYLRRRNLRRKFQWKKNPRKKRWSLQKIYSSFFMTSHILSTSWQKSGRLCFEKKNWRLWSGQKCLNNFIQLRQQ